MGMFKSKGNIPHIAQPKSFAWSWSRVKNFETCPRRYYAIDVTKEVKQDETPQLDEGDRLHKAMAKRVTDDTPLPREFYYMEKYAAALTQHDSNRESISCELKLAIDKHLKPVGFFDRSVWARCVVDYIRFARTANGRELAHIVDYKTGKIVEDDAQLLVNAMLVFCCFENIIGIKSEFLWCKYSDTRSSLFTRTNIQSEWNTLMPRIGMLEQAHTENKFPPKPGKLCAKWCNVETCEHWGG
jgi:hypothetical protein